MKRHELDAALNAMLAETKGLKDAAVDAGGDLSKVDIPGCESVEDKQTYIKRLSDRVAQYETIVKAVDSGYGEKDPSASTKFGSSADPAKRKIEALVKSRALPEDAAGRVDGLLRSQDRRESDATKRWVDAAGDEAYTSAFVKLMGDPTKGHLLWTEQERAAFAKANEVRIERKALFSGSGDGSHLVPLVLDPAIMATSNGFVNPLVELARTEQTATGSWTGLTSDGVTAEWLAEDAEASEVTPVIDDVEVTAHKGSVYATYSIEYEHDSIDGVRQLQQIMADALAAELSQKLATGTGVNQPKGLITALAGTVAEINGSGAEAISATDPYTLQNALAPRWQSRAQWVSNLSVINTLAQMETAAGALKFPGLHTDPPTLLRRRIHELSEMDGSINPAVTASNYSLVYGDFSQFLVLFSIGTTVELIPHVLGANGRPRGRRGIWMYYRIGSDVLVPKAFRLLDVPTTA
jgi:HK97 family phage major capsid protein